MALKICNRGHLGGSNTCRCGRKATLQLIGPSRRRMSKPEKRAITQRLRELGHVPSADLDKIHAVYLG